MDGVKVFNQQKQTVACVLIVAASDESEAPALANALASINGYVDAIYVQLNHPPGKPVSIKIRNLVEQYTKDIYTYVWTGNFVKARNDIFSKVHKKYDWITWIDCDDTVDNPEQIQLNLAIVAKNVNGLRVLYDYDHDEYGNVTVSHWVTRAVRNNKTFEWKSSIDDNKYAVHETLVAKFPTESVATEDFKIIHHADRDHHEKSLLRNIDLLQKMYDHQMKKQGYVDPRILFYLGTHCYSAYSFQKCLDLMLEYLKLSGWAEEKSEAHVFVGNIMKMRGKHEYARTAYLMALGESPDNVTAYVELAQLEFDDQRYSMAVKWLKRGEQIKREITPMVRRDNRYDLYRLLAQSLINIGGKDLQDALKYATKALELRPYDPNAMEHRDYVLELINYRDNMRAVTRLIRELEKGKETDKILPFIKELPKDLKDSVPVIDAYQKYTPAVKWPKKSIAIYIGQSPLGIWGPWSLNEGGIGGSEEAVIRLSQELTSLGWDVTVFGCPGERAGWYRADNNEHLAVATSYDSKTPIEKVVTWKQYWEMNASDTFDILIVWRAPHFYDYKLKARKRYLWLHDLIPKAEFTKERIKNLDRVIYVSQYHADRPEFDAVPKSKKFVSSNGISSSDFVDFHEEVKRDPHRCLYMSANERGLRILLDIWPDVKKAVPKATLDVYYGWHSFDAINRDNPERMAWKASMVQKMKELDGVTERGRVGQDELNKEIFKSGVFAYPCTFPEVNCITAQKAMAGGAVPVVSDFAVMPDIVHKHGDVVPMGKFEPEDIERYKNHLIEMLLNPNRQEHIRSTMMDFARKTYDWKNTASQWDLEMA